jgi:Zn-dependent peptidase ImmA (M78 family)/DNA-binding XRE family transcriptional regulator
MFSGKRLILARQRAGLSKKGLAEAIGAHPRTITRWEDEDRYPSDEDLDKLVECLGFPVEFFMRGELDFANENSASFRSLSSMSARERDSALASGALGFLVFDWIEERYSLPDVDLDDLGHDTPEAAARTLREKWLIGERPISNMIKLLEAKGVRVCSLAENARTVDAFSIWRNEKPYVFLNSQKSAEHQRFDAAHELGHLVLHRHGAPRGREAEHEANRFASSFLMPAADVRAHLPMVYGINTMIKAKKRWKVPVAALNYRLHRVGVITDWDYRSFCIDLQKRGYRTNEPEGIEKEKSEVWQQVFDDLRLQGLSKTDLARELSIPSKEIDNLVFGLVSMLAIDGGGQSTGKASAKLHLVR